MSQQTTNSTLTATSLQGERHEFDVLVIGSGIAGLSFTLQLLKLQPQTRVALLCKTELSESNSRYAQGGIAAVTTADDSIAEHIADTLAAGDGLCNRTAVETIITAGQQAIADLVSEGVTFADGAASLAREGGHSQRRIFHHGDQTGEEIMRVLTARVLEQQQVQIFAYHTAINLITQNEPHQPGSSKEVLGAYVLEEQSGLIHTFLANSVVLATGGAGKTYRYTTNPDVATGDGIAMAARAGARVGNMEFYQFHPTLLYHPAYNNFLISEAVRGEGAYLRLADSGERFMQRYAPDKMELATRDVVARAMFSEIEQTQNQVYLDITHRSSAFLEKRFPNIYRTLLRLGIDMSKDLIPVVPAAHYLCGGVLSDVSGKTDLRRLYAIGETAFTGFHGANRLASNSLLEAVVMARFAAQACFADVNHTIKYQQAILDWNSKGVTDLRRASQINAHWRGLRGEMTSYAGIVRTAAGLKDLLKLILARKQMVEDYYWQHTITRDLIELRNIIFVAETIVRSALARNDSRGGHYREDYPQKSELVYAIV